MTTNDSTQSASPTLPVSNRPLKDFHCLYITQCKVLDSLEIAPPSSWTAYGPNGDVFESPIQVVILDIEDDQAKVGFYAHPALVVKKGSTPDQTWRDAWKKNLDSSAKNTNQPQKQGGKKFQLKKPISLSKQNTEYQNDVDCTDAIDQLQLISETLSYFNHYATDVIADDGPMSLARAAWYEQLFHEVLRKIQGFGAITQAIFILHRYEGLSVDQIASSHSMDVEEVEEHLERVFRIFRDWLEMSL